MTSLNVSWVNATRISQERESVESAFKERLVALCGSPESTKHYHDEHYRQHQSPTSKWSRFVAQASHDSTASLLPSERRLACFVISFQDRLSP